MCPPKRMSTGRRSDGRRGPRRRTQPAAHRRARRARALERGEGTVFETVDAALPAAQLAAHVTVEAQFGAFPDKVRGAAAAINGGSGDAEQLAPWSGGDFFERNLRDRATTELRGQI